MCLGHSYEHYFLKFFWNWHHFNISDMETETWDFTVNYSFLFFKGVYFCGELCSTNVYLDKDTLRHRDQAGLWGEVEPYLN